MSVPPPIRLEHRQIFVNLPAADLPGLREFYRALGWKFNEMFSDEQTASFEISDHIVVMLLAREKFATFHDRATAESTDPREMLNALDAGSPRDVDEMVRRVRQSGGTIIREPEAQGPMYGAAFDDPEGHGWEIVWMDPAAFR
ncbi:VOC family protein [Corynebacterium halotolerans]|uniref:VOC family protein n=1 Tax=Corynebacterium halotolerans TaxID=225326 RepID=UPI003CF98AB9